MIDKINPALESLIVPVASLYPDPVPKKKHSARQLQAIKDSFIVFGQQKPIVALQDGMVIAGNGQLKAIQELGWVKVAVVRFDNKDKAMAYAYALADNRTSDLSGPDEDGILKTLREIKIDLPDFDLNQIGFNQGEIMKLLGRDDDPRENNAPDRGKTGFKKGGMVKLGDHRIMCGDATRAEDVARLMEGEKADMVFTDPPYGVGYVSGKAYKNKKEMDETRIINDNLPMEQTTAMWKRAFEIIRGNLASVNSYYVCGPQIHFMMMMMMMMEAGLPYRHVIIWVKNQQVLSRCDYHYQHEPLLFGWTDTHKFYGEGPFKTSVWKVDRPHKSDLHPTMKPVELIENAILNSSVKGQIILDPFGGSGSTLIASEKTGRKCRMMEIDPVYCQVIVDRWEAFTSKKAG